MAKIWEQYVTIDASVTGERRQKIIEAYDKIAAAADNEGMELLAAGMKNNGGQKTLITSNDNKISALSYPNNQPTINLNFREISAMEVEDAGLRKTPSLMGTIVHESVHATQQMTRVLETVLELGSYPPEFRAEYSKHKDLIRRAVLSNDTTELFKALQHDPALEALSGWVVMEVERIVSGNESEVQREALQKSGYYAADGSPNREGDAVRYTDAFMQKNGCNEPVRGQYSNGDDTGTKDPTAVKNPICSGLKPSQGFKFDPVDMGDLGDMSIPQVRPHQPERAAPTRFK